MADYVEGGDGEWISVEDHVLRREQAWADGSSE